MPALILSLIYATLFVGFLLVWLPRTLLEASGTLPPAHTGVAQAIGVAIGVAGAAIIAWCIGSFAFIGRGTPAPFDAPRQLVVRGPYHHVRNPMYIGAGLVLIGIALFYRSVPVLAYAALFLIGLHLFVRFYEEPTLKRSFGQAYADYCRDVRRWRPRRRRARPSSSEQDDGTAQRQPVDG
ncbi:MAG: isoprenylcysteine carboxylmethyltransferase family protein [Gemmatimonadetes bacterium]|nr:isoprenylcysteine carboxylmethyltransferase family protein [Gemmatimonadota bacterium]